MPRSGLWLRIFVALLLAVLPPIILLVGTLLLTESLLADADPNLVAVVVVVGAVVWAAILGVLFARAIADDIRTFVSLAESGEQVDTPSWAPPISSLPPRSTSGTARLRPWLAKPARYRSTASRVASSLPSCRRSAS